MDRRTGEPRQRLPGDEASELLELGDAFVQLALDWRIVRMNRRAEAISQKPRAEVLGRLLWEVWPEAVHEESSFWREYRRCMDERVSVAFEEYYAPLDMWTAVAAHPVSDGGIVIFYRDITGQKRAEAALRDAEGSLRRMIDLNPIGVARRAASGRVRYANDAYLRIIGRTREDLEAGRVRWDALTAPEYLARDEAAMAQAHERGASDLYEKEYVLDEGRRVPALVACASIGMPDEVTVFVVDLTERKRAEEALRESEARHRAFFQSVMEFAGVHQAVRDGSGAVVDSIVIDANDPTLRFLGATREQVVGKRLRELIPADVVRALIAPWTAVLDTGEPARYEIEFARHRLVVSATRMAADTIAAVADDVTERRRAEETLVRSEAALAQAGAMAHVGAWWIDITDREKIDANPLHWSDEVFRIFGYEPGEVPVSNELFFRHVHPEDRARVSEAVAVAIARREAYGVEHRIIRGDGEERVVLEHAEGHHDEAGRLIRLVGAVQDITERKRGEEALRAREAQFEALIEELQSGVALIDSSGKFSLYNRRFLEMFGLSPEADIANVNSQDWSAWLVFDEHGQLLHVDDHPVRKAALTRRPVRRQLVGVRLTGGGDHRRMIVSAEPILSAEGSVAQIICTYSEVTDLRRAEAALRDANARLREADRRKDEFLGMLSHELRNPLAPIRNALYILDHAQPEGQHARRAKEIATRQVGHLTRLVDDLLDVTRIARGKIELRRADIDLAALARRTAEDYRPLMQDRGLDLAVQLPQEPIVVNGDETRLAQVLGNLLSNAAKFTPAGGRVTLALQVEDGRAVVHVRDTGPGIAPDVLPSLFEPFSQAKQTLARSEGGLGLGLALVKGLVALHGGEVSVVGAGSGGADFVVSLPLVGAEARAAAPVRDPVGASATPRPRRVLVVDDNKDAAESLAELVSMLGHTADVAYDALSALAMAVERVPDVVLCDIGLPGMDGYELARQLRARSSNHHVRLVAVSGYAQPEDVAKAIEAGFDAHVAKPPDPEQLAGILA